MLRSHPPKIQGKAPPHQRRNICDEAMSVFASSPRVLGLDPLLLLRACAYSPCALRVPVQVGKKKKQPKNVNGGGGSVCLSCLRIPQPTVTQRKISSSLLFFDSSASLRFFSSRSRTRSASSSSSLRLFAIRARATCTGTRRAHGE
jgi:hypothetical protein